MSSLTLEDLFCIDSSLARGLKQLLDFDFEGLEELELTFVASTNPLLDNKDKYIDLIPDGSNTYVNRANRGMFVDTFVQYALLGSCKKQVDNYLRGLRICFSGKALSLCTILEIEEIILGQEEIGDLSELRLQTKYIGIYNDEHPIICWFWDILSDYSSFEKHRFLHFVTGSNRVPLGGIKMLKLIIQPILSNTALPSSHTCFNLLDLPCYNSKEQLAEKLKLSLQHYKGFGLI
jgi:hypothetical protein